MALAVPDEPIGYVTLAEANEYMGTHYTSTDPLLISWADLASTDQAALLRKAFQAIELLPFAGRKTCCSQPYAFPRWPCDTVPDAIKFAQVEQAITELDAEASEEAKQYEKMWQWGVSSYTIGNLHESMGTGGYGSSPLRAAGITSAVASRLLRPFIQGGYNIR